MTLALQIIIAAALSVSIVIPLLAFFAGKRTRSSFKKSLAVNCVAFFGILGIAAVVTLVGASSVFAAGSDSVSMGAGLGYIAAALSIGMSGIGSGIGVASSSSAALGAMSEDSSLFGKSLIFVAMAEGIALYGLIIAFMIVGQLG
ncbi:MAG: ATP synthase subunit C [Eubacterium sp.]|nr:ATP synthase subunit C [Eubacterium sp.]